MGRKEGEESSRERGGMNECGGSGERRETAAGFGGVKSERGDYISEEERVDMKGRSDR